MNGAGASRLIAGLAVGAVLLVSCSGSNGPAGGSDGAASPGSTSADPCSLVTADQVSAAVGQAVRSGVVANTGDETLVLCDYNYSDASAVGFVSVGYRTGIARKDLRISGGAGPEAKPVTGIGDAAFGACGTSVGVPYCTLVVSAHGRVMFLQVSMKDADRVALARSLQQLARDAIA